MTNTIPGFPAGKVDFEAVASPRKPTGMGSPAGKSDFMSTLQGALDQVGELQSEADGKVSQLLTGTGEDVHSAMIAVEKASLTFQMMLQVRNKIVAAYQQVSSIPF